MTLSLTYMRHTFIKMNANGVCPNREFPDDFKLVLPQSQTNKNACNVYSAALRSHPETWLHFDWEDVQYIIVPDELARKEIIHKIRSLNNLKTMRNFS